ncbi:hypothetical protein VR43_13220 [Streptomyces sp. NRRL S-104]|nr:hypothetical protein VR43_13220 [Streptomyces sp. NRRL S-104]
MRGVSGATVFLRLAPLARLLVLVVLTVHDGHSSGCVGYGFLSDHADTRREGLHHVDREARHTADAPRRPRGANRDLTEPGRGEYGLRPGSACVG